MWRFHHRSQTASTNRDAVGGMPGDVFTADFQTAGRGRLDHRWLSAPGEGLLMSVVLDVADLPPEQVSTLPLVVGLAVARALARTVRDDAAILPASIKWPNDVLVEGLKIAGILCERHDDRVIAGIGVNVGQQTFPDEIAARATSVAIEARRRMIGGALPNVTQMRDAILMELEPIMTQWRSFGFAAVHPHLQRLDALKGRFLRVRQQDDDDQPVRGVCGGILPDGALDVGGVRVYAGETHVESNERQ